MISKVELRNSALLGTELALWPVRRLPGLWWSPESENNITHGWVKENVLITAAIITASTTTIIANANATATAATTTTTAATTTTTAAAATTIAAATTASTNIWLNVSLSFYCYH